VRQVACHACYQIDGRLLRTGAANFSASGLKRQDNDLIVIESAAAAAAFKRALNARFASGAPPPAPGLTQAAPASSVPEMTSPRHG
jgi:phosphatidylserine/phosphatidylglycerophosphate/cardiolipin synthase-like enzyme